MSKDTSNLLLILKRPEAVITAIKI
jgi:hypothetical protein